MKLAMQLHLRIVEAVDIAKMDLFSKSDPYVLAKINQNGITQRTNYIMNTSTPRWNAEFHFPLSNPSSDSLHLLMRDKDTVSDDDMATLTIPICSLPPGQVIDQWYNMIPCRRVKKGGRIHLILHVAPFGATAFVPQPTFQQNFMGMQNTMMGMGRLMNPMMGAVPPNPMYHPQPMNLQPAMYPQMMNQQQMLRQSQPTMYPQMMNQQQMLRQSQPTMMNQPMVQPIPMYQPPQNPYNQNMMPMQNGFGQTPRPYNINASIPGMSEKDIRKMQKRQRQMMGY